MASIETDRALVEDGLRVTQLLPSIVIGHSRTGNNRGDTKVRERARSTRSAAPRRRSTRWAATWRTGPGPGSWDRSPPPSPRTARPS